MSLVRVTRPRAPGNKPPKAKKKKPPPPKRDWDNTVHDLTVHRATPEDMVRRHEIHKSKNKALVHVELQERALKRKWKKQRQGAPDSLEKRKLALMREILSDQYQLQDVLERSDQAMAVVKDLFGDAPHRHTGFPNVTMAPHCDLESSQGPIVQKSDPPTQLSILSESIMDPQALNEVEGEGSSNCQSEDSVNEQDVSLHFKSNVDIHRLLHLLKEENAAGASQLWAEKQLRTPPPSQKANVAVTPTTALPSSGAAALNATRVVQRVHSRLQNEDEEQTSDSSYTVRQVLNPNPRKQKQVSTKAKRNHTAQMASKQRRNDSLANAVSFELPSGNKSSLDVLNRMIHEVEHEMEEYERWTGREVQRMQNGHGLTGFTVSLVNTLCRLMRYLKEGEMQLRQEATMRQQLEGMLHEHRALIDALTTEILLVREENAAIQKRLQQYMVVTDEQLISLTQAFKSLPVTDPNRGQSPTDFGVTVNSQEKPALYSTVPRTDIFRRENTLVFSQEELPVKLPQWSSPPDIVVAGSSLPAHMFQPAVLLSPPRQKSIQEFSPLQNALKKTVNTYPASHFSPSMETTVREPNWQKNSSSSVGTQNTNEENRLLTQRWRIPPSHKDLESSLPSDGQQGRSTLSPVDRWAMVGSEDEQKPSAPEEHTQSNDLLGQIAELTLQNSVIKAQLSKFRDRSQEAGDGLHQPVTKQNMNTSSGSAMEGQTFPEVPKSLEERIAELNRQSAEARGKLLQLIDQQKLATVNPISPPVSPVLPPHINWTENEKRTIEVSVPVAETMDSSKGDTPSPASGTSVRRSTGASSKTCSTLSTTSGSMKLTPVNQRTKALGL
ncbi:spindle and centriole-associated protein 1 isoform X2 [Gopherus flavomarginatus]|uniref:spindle and centriole-associated protein 1 isoform X2 n=1 Tax=Gopherus flavomarginatus TaxID=286002 RepID=UPI0021CC0B29|nr:spindle and centriole-associated protein 1 isoform X2 [Gopherus flavomarginatus]